jgi:hypothetical protein
MRLAASCLVVAMASATIACSLFGRSAPSGGGGQPRRFYLTKGLYQGNQVLGVCAHGYHTASRFEIWNVSALTYETEIGLTTGDSGSGPPSVAAPYGSSGPTGWVRTGGGSAVADPKGEPGSAAANCAAWSTNSHEAVGTIAYLIDRFAGADSAGGAWNGGPQACDVATHVWCVQDADADFSGSSSDRPHRHRRY